MNPATEWPVPTDDQLTEAAMRAGLPDTTPEQRRRFFSLVRLIHGRDHFMHEHQRAVDSWERTVTKIEAMQYPDEEVGPGEAES